jgi:hypothetical protein
MGELYTDSAGAIFYCTASGTPGTWAEVGAAAEGAVLIGENNAATATTEVTTTSGIALYGTQTETSGLLGTQLAGVVGDSSINTGVAGASQSGTGVSGQSNSGPGVTGGSAATTGVLGTTSGDGKNGVWGVDQSTGGGHGVAGTSTAGYGIGMGVRKPPEPSSGLDQSPGGGYGVYGSSGNGTGVYGPPGRCAL